MEKLKTSAVLLRPDGGRTDLLFLASAARPRDRDPMRHAGFVPFTISYGPGQEGDRFVRLSDVHPRAGTTTRLRHLHRRQRHRRTATAALTALTASSVTHAAHAAERIQLTFQAGHLAPRSAS